jgi:hypothetical protein
MQTKIGLAYSKLYTKCKGMICVPAMVCEPCIVIPFLLFLWYHYIQPIVLKFWNPWKAVDTTTQTKILPVNLTDKSNKETNNCPVANEGKKSL